MPFTSESARKSWATRRLKGGPYNQKQINADGTVREGSIVIDEDTGCWIWQHSCRGTTPQGLVEGRSAAVSVRSFLCEVATGRKPELSYAECGNYRCVNPKHATTTRIEYTSFARKKMIQAHLDEHPMATTGEMARELNVSDDTIRRAVGKRPLSSIGKRWSGRPTPRRPEQVNDRNWNIFLRAISGESLAPIGADYGLSRERVRVICDQVELWVKRKARPEYAYKSKRSIRKRKVAASGT